MRKNVLLLLLLCPSVHKNTHIRSFLYPYTHRRSQVCDLWQWKPQCSFFSPPPRASHSPSLLSPTSCLHPLCFSVGVGGPEQVFKTEIRPSHPYLHSRTSTPYPAPDVSLSFCFGSITLAVETPVCQHPPPKWPFTKNARSELTVNLKRKAKSRVSRCTI